MKPDDVDVSRRDRRRFLIRAGGGLSALMLAGCDRLTNSKSVRDTLASAQWLTRDVQHAIGGRQSLAREYTKADIAPVFRANGSTDPQNPEYLALVNDGFHNWRLPIGGLVEQRMVLSLDQLKAMPAQTQITRHDCVEGWSCIGQWTGVQLKHVLALARPKPRARYVVFHCYDTMDDGQAYYESINLIAAVHPQTILAYNLNGQPLPIANGAPIRLRVERQLGYKQAKYLKGIVLVESFAGIAGGHGGYWEDQGYAWYAGI